MEVFTNAKHLLYDPAFPLLDIYLKDTKTYVYKKRLYTMIIAALFITAEKLETVQVSINR